MNIAPDLDHEMQKLEGRLPDSAARLSRWLRDPSARWLRLPIGILLIPGGLLGFLPILGFWMVPIGLGMISHDIPFLRKPMAKLTAHINRKLESKR
jgi:hypothetical protein